MIDTTKIELIGKQLDKVVDGLTQHHERLSSGEIALIASLIGVIGGILPQIIIFFLTRKKESKNKQMELLAEERRISFLLDGYFRLFIHHSVGVDYWYYCHELSHKERDYQQSLDAAQGTITSMDNINIGFSEYYKTINHFMALTKQNKVIKQTIEDIEILKIREPKDYSKINSTDELYKEMKIDSLELENEYYKYRVYFDRINNEMLAML